MRLPRGTFVATISVLFVAITAMQIASLITVHLLPLPLFLAGFPALAVLLGGMQVGTLVGKRLSGAAFDRMTLALLFLMSLRLLYGALAGGCHSALGFRSRGR